MLRVRPLARARPAYCRRIPLAHRGYAAAPPPGPTPKTDSAQPSPQAAPRGIKISHLFGGLVGLGLLITTYGLLEYYYSLQIWPEPVRTPLKKALKAKLHGEWDKAEGFFNEAIALAKEHPPSLLDPDPLQKLSGIYISLAAMLESNGKEVRAFNTLLDAYGLFGPSPLAAQPGEADGWYSGPLGELDVTRAIGLAQKLGTLAAKFGGQAIPPPCPGATGDNAKAWDLKAEKFLGDAVTAMLRVGLAGEPEGDTKPAKPATPVVIGRDVSLPQDGDTAPRVNTKGLGMTMEALAEVYARRERPDLAGHLLLQAISAIMPPTLQEGAVDVGERCHAAMLMTAVSSHALAPGTDKAIRAAKSWSLRALQVADRATKDAGWSGMPVDVDSATCARARSVAMFNLGMLAEMKKENDAEKYFTAALGVARETGFAEGKREASEALRRLRDRS